MEKLESLWGDEIEEELPVKKKEKTKKALDKIAKPKKPKEAKESVEKVIKSKSINLEDKLNLIKSEVLRVLAKQVENVTVITSREKYFEYLQGAVNSGVIAVDTETNNSLDPITCKLMGLCLYYPGAKQAYIPVNHRNYKTGERLTNQLTEQDIKDGLEFVLEKSFSRGGWIPDYDGQSYIEWYQNHIEPLSTNSSIEWVFHNGKFDYQVIKKTCGIEVPITWDTLLGAKLIDENEFSAGLKQQYISKIDPEQEKYDIEHLFEGVEYADVDAAIFSLYAATDSYMTYRLYKEYQLPIFESKDYTDVYELFREIEVPCITVTAEMELNGIEIDQEYSKRLQNKYHARLEKLDAKLINLLNKLKETIDNWKNTNDALQSQMKKQSEKQRANALKSANYDDSLWKYQDGTWYKLSKSKLEQLGENLTPKELGSPVKLAIVLYSILKAPRVNDEKPDGTGEDELKAIIRKSDNNDIKELCTLMLDRRELDKLLNSFIDTLPNKVNVDNRIHCHFNQYGAATGRFSCSEPNLQQIPSHNKEIRMMFRAKEGYMLLGSDFSQQEPRLLSQFSQDTNMINAYKNGKDLYATIAMGVYHNKYEDNLEFNPDGTPSADGAKRRSSCKSLLLGIMYGRGVASIAEQIKGTVEEAQQIIDNFYNSFPQVKKWIQESEEFAKKTGYVSDLWGRRRRLPDILLPQYTIRYKDKNMANGDFNPFIGCVNRTTSDKLIKEYENKLSKIKGRKQYDAIKNEALGNGIEIINNGGFISQAQRQCVNARIQGSAATMTKKAMIKIYKDKELRDLGFRLAIGVHDELIGECPEQNIDRAAELLTYDMKSCAQDKVSVPFKCDADISYNWYWNSFKSIVLKEFLDYAAEHSNNYKEAYNYIVEEHTELTAENLLDVVEGYDIS